MPSGAPPSTHAAIVSICLAVRLGSLSHLPMAGSAPHGGISRAVVRRLTARAHGPRVLVGQERHRRHARADGTRRSAIQDRCDVLAEGRRGASDEGRHPDGDETGPPTAANLDDIG